MGVMQCFRRGCTSVMCDRYSITHGYICSDCFDELVSLGVDTDIEEFLSSDPSLVRGADAYTFFDEEFPHGQD